MIYLFGSDYMKTSEIKKLDFPAADFSSWEDAAAKSLKGKSVSSLSRNTYEGIQIDPLYYKNGTITELPGQRPYTRGTEPAGSREGTWGIAQCLRAEDHEELFALVEEAVKKGQNTISFDAELFDSLDAGRLQELMRKLRAVNLPFFLDLKGRQEVLFRSIKDDPELQAGLRGAAAEDLISDGASAGSLPVDKDKFSMELAARLKAMNDTFPGLRSLLVKASVYHNAGASAVQELAFALALGVEYLEMGRKEGIDACGLSEKMVFSFAVGSSFFMEIAKLRAARRLWSRIGEAYKDEIKPFRMEIHAETSAFSQTVFDPHVNILRTAGQAFAAAVGNVQYLQIHPFDLPAVPSSPLAGRIARNIHHILSEEAQLKHSADPAGGSWYVEKLTDQLAESAWELFLEIEDMGGAWAALESGWIQEQIGKTFNDKAHNVMIRKEKLVGTNVYADLSQSAKPGKGTSDGTAAAPENHVEKGINALKPKRMSEEAEAIRHKAAAMAERRGTIPRVGLIGLGALKEFKPRADFIRSFFAAGGIHSDISPPIYGVNQALSFISTNEDVEHFLICGTDEAYENEAVQYISAIKAAFPHKRIYIAGRLAKELAGSAEKAGLNGSIHQNTSLDLINTFLVEMEGKTR
ncbi:methylmalonyl-CoA mutase family protein [Peribacillus sp. SCS-26]|uniref:methylmalonyl-CoA mutase family protein n=1 Tax=Paraperibacillus marinus TaxID=3115295 RepID=UPI00390660CD